jgi:uncharacterized protein (TIGR02996 family)
MDSPDSAAQPTLGQILFQSAWELADPGVLLVLADWLDENGDADTAELLRLSVAESQTGRHSSERTARLRWLRANAQAMLRLTSWPNLGVEGVGEGFSFSRRPDRDRPAREYIVARPGHRTVRWLRVDVEGDDEVIRARQGQELLRRRLPLATLGFIAAVGDYYLGSAFILGEDHFPLPEHWRETAPTALAVQRHRLEQALAPAAVQPTDLPGELLGHAAWLLCDYLCDKRRRVRAGEAVPGTHFFLFWPDSTAWEHAEMVASEDARKAVASLRKRFRSQALHVQGGPRAGLLVEVSDEGQTAAGKLFWVVRNKTRESPDLPSGAGATLSAEQFRRALDDLLGGVAPEEGPSGLAERFVLATPASLRDLFASRFAGVGGSEGG